MKSLFAKTATHAIAAFMVFWLSGVLFLLCCGTMQGQAESEFCPLAAKGRSHCDRAKKDSGLPSFSKESGNLKMDCCGFLPAVFDKTRKIEKIEQVAQPADKIKVDLPKFSFTKNEFRVVADYNPPVSKWEKIFIKNCVFRI